MAGTKKTFLLKAVVTFIVLLLLGAAYAVVFQPEEARECWNRFLELFREGQEKAGDAYDKAKGTTSEIYDKAKGAIDDWKD